MSAPKKFGFKRMNTLAKEANKKITVNKYLLKKYDIFNHYNLLTKDIMNKCLSDQNVPPLTYFNQYSKELENDYNNIKIEYNNTFSKFNTLLDECRSDISMGKPILTERKNDEFTLEYSKIKKTNIIDSIKKSIKSSKDYHLFREPKRDNLVDIKEGNKEMEKITNELQQSMLYECKRCNKYINKIIQYKSKTKAISKNIELLKKYIEDNKFKLSNFKAFSQKDTIEQSDNSNLNDKNTTNLNYSERTTNTSNFINKIHEKEFENNSDDDRCNNNNKGKKSRNIIMDFMSIEKMFDVSNEEGEKEKIIDNELHSDDESIFENKIKTKNQLSMKYLKKIKKTINSLDLKQIHFNAAKAKEIDIYSLQRRKYKNKNIDSKIKEMKNKIENMNNKLILFKQKENIIREFVKKLEENYEAIQPMIYQKSEANIKQSGFIFESLNGKYNNKNDEIDFDDNFLDNIEEVDEVVYNENEQNEINEINDKEEDKKDTKDIKETKNDYDIEERKLEIKILNSVLKKKMKNIHENVNIKPNKKKLIVSLTSTILKKINTKKNEKRARSK